MLAWPVYCGQFLFRRLPAGVLERRAGDCRAQVAHQAQAARCQAWGRARCRIPPVGPSAAAGEQALERRGGIAMDVAHGRADLCVVVAADVLLQKIDQPGLALQDREQRQRVAARGDGRAGAAGAAGFAGGVGLLWRASAGGVASSGNACAVRLPTASSNITLKKSLIARMIRSIFWPFRHADQRDPESYGQRKAREAMERVPACTLCCKPRRSGPFCRQRAPGMLNWKCDSGNATIRAISGPLSSGSMIEIAHRIPECDGAASYAMIRARDSAVKIPTGLYT